jgi:hypothetical protein
MTADEAVQTVIIDKLKSLIEANDMVATRELLNSIRYEKNESLGLLSYDIIALDYIVDLNDGVAPIANPDFKDFGTGPQISKLIKWIDAKGLDYNPFAVRANIMKFGTSWFQKGGSHIVTDTINAEAFAQVVELAKPELQNKIKSQWQLLFKNNR